MGWLYRAPRQLPTLQHMVDILGSNPRDMARHLGVAERTVYHWLQHEQAPRAAMLALFWETPYGLSVAEAEAVNAARVAQGLAEAQAREIATLRARIAYLERTGDFGAANQPLQAQR